MANSNDIAENREGTIALGDACDPVPVFVSRQAPTSPKDPQPQTAYFTSSAGIGYDSPTKTQPTVTNTSVGFRHCDCGTPTTRLSASQCMTDGVHCTNDPTAFHIDVNHTFNDVTVADQTSVGSSTGILSDLLQLHRDFTGKRSLDTSSHPTAAESEPWRVGELESIRWFPNDDVLAKRVKGYGLAVGQQQTAGVFWSHASLGASTGSARDASGRLRDHYEYVVTPDIAIPAITAPTTIQNPCASGPCTWWFDRSWLRDPGPEVYITQPTSLQQLTLPSTFVASANAVLAVRNGIEGAIDVTSSLSPAVRTAISDPAVMPLSPVEASFRGRMAGVAMPLVALPRTWSQGTSRITRVVSDDGSLYDSSERREVGVDAFEVSAVADGPIVDGPGNRSGFRAAYTATEGYVYLVGGDDNGTPLRDVWSAALLPSGISRWERLLTPPTNVDTHDAFRPYPEDVQSVAFDDRHGWLVIVDFATIKGPFGSKHEVARILTMDVRSRAVRVALVVPRLHLFERVGVTARDDGQFILAGAHGIGAAWSAFRFAVAADGSVKFNGIASGTGRLLDEPHNATAGTMLRLAVGKMQQVVVLADGSFKNVPSPCTAM